MSRQSFSCCRERWSAEATSHHPGDKRLLGHAGDEVLGVKVYFSDRFQDEWLALAKPLQKRCSVMVKELRDWSLDDLGRAFKNKNPWRIHRLKASSMTSLSVPSGDGRNPSPSGEEKSVVVWSRAAVSIRSAHENRSQSPPGLDPEVSEARVGWGGGRSCARSDPTNRDGARVDGFVGKSGTRSRPRVCVVSPEIRTSAQSSNG